MAAPSDTTVVAPSQDTLLFQLAKGSLDILSKVQQRSYKGLGQAVGDCRKVLSKDMTKKLRALQGSRGT